MLPFTYTEAEASESDAKHLVLRQLAKDVTVRISQPLQVLESKQHTNLLAVSDINDLAFAATNSGFSVIPLSELRSFFKSAARNTTPTFDQPLRSINTVTLTSIASPPTFVTCANRNSSVLVGFQNGVIAAWSVAGLVEGNKLDPTFVLQPPSPGLALIDFVPNPSDRPELAVALYRQDGTPGVNSGTPIIVNLNSGSFGAQLDATASRATAVCWSVKGKQIAVGLESGEIAQITPEGEPKDRIAKPESLQGPYHVSDLRWLENHVFIATYNLPSSGSPQDDPEHSYDVYTILRDAKPRQITFVKMPMDPAPPYGDTSRPGTRYTAWLKGWEPFKHLVFVASGPSTDVGLVSCSSSQAGTDAWSTVELEETSKPTLPFSSVDQSSDTAPVAIAFDLTSADEVEDPNAVARGDGNTKMPSVPILYVYTSDGVLLAYNVINTKGPFEGMITPSGAPVSAPTSAPASTPAPPATAPASTTAAPALSTPSQRPLATPAFGSSSAIGKPTAFGQSSAFGSTSAFGQSSAFGQPSAFGSPSSASAPSPAFGAASKPTSGFGFGAFSSGAGNSKPASAFGSTSFGFGTATKTSDVSTGTPKEVSASASSSAPASISDANVFGAKSADYTFGSPSPASAASSLPGSSAFGSLSAFGQTAGKPALGQPSAFGQTSLPAFGSSSGFGSTSDLGTKSAFGSTSSSPFASKATPSTQPSSGSVFSAFGTTPGTSNAKPVSGAFGGFASKSGSAFGSAASPGPGSVFGSGGKLETQASDAPTALFGASDSQKPGAAPVSVFGQRSAFAANKAADDKDGKSKDHKPAANGRDDAGSFSFAALGGMLGSNDSALSSQSQPKQCDKKEDGITTPDSGVDSTVPTPRSESASNPFSFNTSTATASTCTKDAEASAAAKATSPPPSQPAFSSFKPGFNAGGAFGSQPFSLSANNKAGAISPTPPSSTPSAAAPVAKSNEPSKAEAEGNKAEESSAEAEQKANEPASSIYSFFNAPVNAEPKPTTSTPFSFASASKPSESTAETTRSTEEDKLASADSGKSTSLSPSSNNAAPAQAASIAKPTSFGGFGFGASPASSTAQSKDAPACSFANLNKSVPPPSPTASASGAPASASTAAPAKTASASAYAPAASGSFLGFHLSAPRSSSPLAGTPANSSDKTLKGISEKSRVPAANANKPVFGSSGFGAKPATAAPFGPSAFSGLGQRSALKPTETPEDASAAAARLAAPTFGGLASAPAKSAPPSAAIAPALASKGSGSLLAAGRTPQLSSSIKDVPAKVSESGIQGEFLKAYLVLNQELNVLRSNVDQCAAFLADLREPTAHSQTVQDFADSSKWSFGDLPKMLSLAKSLRPLTQQIEEDATSHRRNVAEMQSLQLKAEAKREEVARFIRARSDPEFAKMIRIRQLGPEHVENQNKLRKASQVVRDRIVELEEYLAVLKDKLQNAKAGRTALKAPSLDSVARACRNITARTTAVTLELDNLALEVDLMRPANRDYLSRQVSRALSRSVSVISGIDDSGSLDDVSNLVRTLPAAITLRSADEITLAERVKSGSVAVFVGAREKPILNTRVVPSSQRTSRKSTTPMQGSDIQIAFAKGPVHLGKRPLQAPPVVSAADAPIASATLSKPAQNQFAPLAKSVPLPMLSKPPSSATSSPPSTTTSTIAAPVKFGFPASPGLASSKSSSAAPASAAPAQKTATPSSPLNLGDSGSPATAPAKDLFAPFSGFGSSPAPAPASSSVAAAPATASKAPVPSTPLGFGGFGTPAAPSSKPSGPSFSGFESSFTPATAAPTSATSATAAAKPSIPSSSLKCGGFGAVTPAFEPTPGRSAGCGTSPAPSPAAAPTTASTPSSVVSQKTSAPAAPLSFGGSGTPAAAPPKTSSAPFAGFGPSSASADTPADSTKPAHVPASSASSPFGSGSLSNLNFGELTTMPAGMFDLPSGDDASFQPGGRAPSSSPSTIRATSSGKSRTRGAAVALPPANVEGLEAKTAAAAKAASDFFAQPIATKPKEADASGGPATTAFKGFSGFASANKDSPNSEASNAAPKPTYCFGDLGRKTGTASSAEAAEPVAGGFSFAKKDNASPMSSPASEQKAAANGFSFGNLGGKDELVPTSASPMEASKPAAGGLSFASPNSKTSESAPQSEKPAFDRSSFAKKDVLKTPAAATSSQAAKFSFSFGPTAATKPASDDKSDKAAGTSFSFAPVAAATSSAEVDKDDLKKASEKADSKNGMAENVIEDTKSIVAEEPKDHEAKDADASDKAPAEKVADTKSPDSDIQMDESSRAKDINDKRAEVKDQFHPNPATFAFCKPSKPRNTVPLAEPSSDKKEEASTAPVAKDAPIAGSASSFNFMKPPARTVSEKKDEQPATAADEADKSEKEDTESAKTESKEADSATATASNGTATPPKAQADENPKNAPTTSTTSTPAFSFSPSKLSPGTSTTASSSTSAFGGFKSTPGFGFGAFFLSKPLESPASPSTTTATPVKVNAFSFNPQTSTTSSPGSAFGSPSAFGSTIKASSGGGGGGGGGASAFGSVSAFGTPGGMQKSAFGTTSGFGAYAKSPSCTTTTTWTGGEKSVFGSTSTPSTNTSSGFAGFASSPSAANEDKSASTFTGSKGGFEAFASKGGAGSSPFATAGQQKACKEDDKTEKEEGGDKSGASLLSRFGAARAEGSSRHGEDQDEEGYTDEDEDEERYEDEDEGEEDYDDDEEDFEDEEEDYADEDEEDGEEVEQHNQDDDDDDDAKSDGGGSGENTLDASAVHVSKSDLEGQGDALVAGTEDDDEEEEEEEIESERDIEEEEEGLSAVEEEPEEE
ncbi:related to nucleoporin [Melanopsichium pennsylvanicum]|uniref:Related to nucleoporin n=2 Tax=Melanopsichium pennsylvanicum TaxID=63383 RepID=A0AAJ5C3D4_9BASI|nr:related to nucleoporin [Melanopsichium pennsylvanicum 4]SNX82472.1 related to nucleoporin [Melanopsichium pennsylvanicum]